MEEIMKKQHYSTFIKAPIKKVWAMMLEPESYKDWTSEFMPGSYYEGSWETGKKIKFLGPGGEGGMTSMIAENRPLEFISIKHLGYIKDGIEDTQSPEIKAWAPAYENYTFTRKNDGTEVSVDLDVLPDIEDFMEETWPKALTRLKKICE
jgi:hypothetical protein